MPFIIYALLLTIQAIVTFSQSTQIKFESKVFKFINDIRPDYSVAADIYREIYEEEREKQVQANSRPARPPQNEQKPAPVPVPEPAKQAEPLQAEAAQEKKELLPSKVKDQKLKLQKYAEFEEFGKLELKQSTSFTVNNIQEGSVLRDGQISALKLEPTSQKTKTSQKVVKEEPQVPVTPKVPSVPQIPLAPQIPPSPRVPSPPQLPPPSHGNEERKPLKTREQEILQAMQRTRTPVGPQPPLQEPEAAIPSIPKQPTSNVISEQIRIESNPIPTPTIEKPQLIPPEPPKINYLNAQQQISKGYKYIFTIFLGLAVLIIVFSYTPEEEKSQRRAYNPTDDEEVSLA